MEYKINITQECLAPLEIKDEDIEKLTLDKEYVEQLCGKSHSLKDGNGLHLITLQTQFWNSA